MGDCFEYYPEGYLEVGEIDDREPEIRINRHKAKMLVAFMRENGYIPRNIQSETRNDDVELMKKQLDIIENFSKKG